MVKVSVNASLVVASPTFRHFSFLHVICKYESTLLKVASQIMPGNLAHLPVKDLLGWKSSWSVINLYKYQG